MKVTRTERVVDIMDILVRNPRKHFTLSYFVKRYNSNKASISEDIKILKQIIVNRKSGKLITTTGAKGHVEFVPEISEAEADELAVEVTNLVADPSRVLPGGYIYLTDVIAMPQILHRFGELIATRFQFDDIDAVVTVATKGIPLAVSVAEQLGVPFVVARVGSGKVTEGPTISTPFTTGTRQISKLELSTRALDRDQNIIFVDDFMKNGGTFIGLYDLAEEFNARVKGVAVFAEGRETNRQIKDFISLINVETNLDDGNKVRVIPGNYKKIFERKRKLEANTGYRYDDEY